MVDSRPPVVVVVMGKGEEGEMGNRERAYMIQSITLCTCERKKK